MMETEISLQALGEINIHCATPHVMNSNSTCWLMKKSSLLSLLLGNEKDRASTSREKMLNVVMLGTQSRPHGNNREL